MWSEEVFGIIKLKILFCGLFNSGLKSEEILGEVFKKEIYKKNVKKHLE